MEGGPRQSGGDIRAALAKVTCWRRDAVAAGRARAPQGSTLREATPGAIGPVGLQKACPGRNRARAYQRTCAGP